MRFPAFVAIVALSACAPARPVAPSATAAMPAPPVPSSTFDQWRAQRIAVLAALEPNHPGYASGVREIAVRSIAGRSDPPRTPAERQRAIQVETASIDADIDRIAGPSRRSRTVAPRQPVRGATPPPIHQGGCTPTNPCVGPRGGLYYVTAAGNRVYLRPRR